MRLSSENSYLRWISMVVVWCAITAVLVTFTREAGQYFARVGRMGLAGAADSGTPLKSPLFSFAADAQTWIRYALQLDEGHELQLRRTDIDNAPYGRQVHWNSAWAWTIADAGKLRSHFTREPLPLATERAALWLNCWVLLAIVVVLSAWVAKRAGALAGGLIAVGVVGSDRFYEGFIPTYVDHHGLLTASAFGLTLGIVFMGAGWWQLGSEPSLLPKSKGAVRTAALVSAICGALGLWVSAASVVPPIAFVGGAALFALIIAGRKAMQEGAYFDARAWRIWGCVGGGLSLIFYLLEYAPSNLGMRLEVNHPLYAFAWWGGAEVIAQIGERWLGIHQNNRGNSVRMGLAVLALMLVPSTVLVGRASVFLPLDPFLATLHHDISEFMSLPQRVSLWGWGQVVESFDQTAIGLLAGMVVLALRRKRSNLLLWFTVAAATAFIALGLWQERWLLNASGPLLCVTLVTVAVLGREYILFRRPTLVIAIIGLLFVPTVTLRLRAFHTMASGQINEKDALQPLFRSIAAALRASQPEGGITVLASPNTSTGVGYYGRFKTIGTLYWENDAGLKAAAEIFSAHTDDEAAKLIKERGITHIAMVSEENFLKQYYTLLHPGATDADVQKSFGYRLLGSLMIPVWLEVLPYDVPPDLKPLNQKVVLYKVAFSQTPADALYHLAMAQVAWNDLPSAEKSLNQLSELAPGVPQVWLRKAEVLVREGKWGQALGDIKRAASLAPAAERSVIYMSAGKAFYDGHAQKYAVAMYRQVLAVGFDPTAAHNLAWILATSVDGSLRDGGQALEITKELVRLHPDSCTYLGGLAAALAETGDPAGAARVAESALEKSGIEPGQREALEKQLSVYRAGKPWRQ